jgi:hypothetical protein
MRTAIVVLGERFDASLEEVPDYLSCKARGWPVIGVNR